MLTFWHSLQHLFIMLADLMHSSNGFGIAVLILWSAFFGIAFYMYKTGRGNL